MVEDVLRGYFDERREIKAAYLFGSFASGRNTDGSDVDIALLTEPFKMLS